MAPPIRVANALLDVARTYSDKQVFLYFNDLNTARVEELKKHLPPDERNFKIITLNEDATELLDTIGRNLKNQVITTTSYSTIRTMRILNGVFWFRSLDIGERL